MLRYYPQLAKLRTTFSRCGNEKILFAWLVLGSFFRVAATTTGVLAPEDCIYFLA
jgi:hypothetical protein